MADIEVEEEVVEATEEELYDSEYDKAWSGEEEDLEQPNEEVADDVDVPDETVVEEDSNDEEIVEEDTPIEEDTENTDDKPSDDFAEVLKWNKQEIPVTREELRSLAQKGFDSEKKWQEAAINRPIKALVDKYGFTPEQLEMFGNIVKDKNPEALALLAQQNDIDMFEAEHKNYTPVVEQKNYELDDVIAEINRNEDIAVQMNDYVSSVPQSVKDTLTSNPAVLRGLNTDMVNGIGQKVMPEVIKQLAINPNQDFVRLYQDIGTKMFSEEETKQEEKPKRVEPTREEKKRVAVPKKNSAPKKTITDDYDAAWDDNEHFEAVRRRLSGF